MSTLDFIQTGMLSAAWIMIFRLALSLDRLRDELTGKR